MPSRDLIDISVPLKSGMHVFEGNPELALTLEQSMDQGAEANVSSLKIGVHSGTHIDAPVHFLPQGAGAEAAPLDVLVGEATVIDATAAPGHVGAESLRALNIPDGCRRLLVKTRNSQIWSGMGFSRDFQGLAGDGAAYLVQRGIQLIGWDYLSIGPFGDATETHQTLLQADVTILEGIDLREVTPGDYELICLPLKLHGSDGAPARAVLRRI